MTGADIEDIAQDIPLHPDEAIHVAAAAPGRRRDFALGRFCARAALTRMGIVPTPLAIGDNGAPLWPAGVVGSITHTRGYAAAIVAATDRVLGVGVDAERVGGVTEKLMPRLFNACESGWLMALEAEKRPVALTVFFSAKEACYKAFNPLSGVRPSFWDMHVELGADRFAVTLADGAAAQGRVLVRGDLVITMVCLPRP